MRTSTVLGAMTTLALAIGCASAPDGSATVDATGADRAGFPPVAAALSYRCGSLDCHGSLYRNMRLYGYGGLRFAPGDTPERPATSTPEEIDRSFDAVVGLEPTILREVVTSGGAHPERLTFVRKGRGQEAHKGGSRIAIGDDADRCITSWLSGTVDVPACTRVVPP